MVCIHLDMQGLQSGMSYQMNLGQLPVSINLKALLVIGIVTHADAAPVDHNLDFILLLFLLLYLVCIVAAYCFLVLCMHLICAFWMACLLASLCSSIVFCHVLNMCTCTNFVF